MRYNEVYLDNLTSAPMSEEVAEELTDYFIHRYGSPLAYHQFGQWSKTAMEYFAEKVMEILHSETKNCSFTLGVRFPLIDDGAILLSPFESPQVENAVDKLENEVITIPLTNWIYDINWLEKQLKKGKIALVVVSYADRITGTIQPFEEIIELCNRYSTPLFVDLSVLIGRGKFPLLNLGSAYGYINGKVFGAPCDLIIGEKLDLQFPHQLSAGFLKSLEIIYENLDDNLTRLSELSEYFWEMLQLHLPHLTLLGGNEKVSGVMAIAFQDVDRQAMMLALDMQGVMVWAGDSLYSPIKSLLHSDVPEHIADSTLRFSFWYHNTKQEIDYVLRVLPPLVDRVRYEKKSPRFQAD
ncbi:hypothetical protein DRQ33_03905 [bacterium]|nr:MAG: hypothetical protein DRQ33_03905 [bacterium]